MVPEFIKESRWKRVDEAILTAYGLMILDSMMRSVSFKRAKKTRATLKGMIDFQQWEGNDDHRLRVMYVCNVCMYACMFICLCTYSRLDCVSERLYLRALPFSL